MEMTGDEIPWIIFLWAFLLSFWIHLRDGSEKLRTVVISGNCLSSQALFKIIFFI